MTQTNRLLLLSLFLAFTAACRLNPTDGLRWETDLLVPLAKTELSLAHLIQDSSLYTVGNDQLISLILRDTFASAKLIDLLSLPDTNVTLTVGLDSLTLSSDTIAQRITLGQIAQQMIANGDNNGSLILSSHGLTLLFVPEIPNISSDPIDIDASQFFEYALLDSGELVLSIENQLPLPIKNVILVVTNLNLPGPPIVQDTFDLIPSGASVSRTYDLSGKQIESQLQGQLVNLDIGGGLQVPVDTTDFIQVSLVAQNLKAQTATAIFPEQTLIDTTRQTEYQFGGEYADVRLTKLVVKSGKILARSISTVEDTIAFFYSLPSADNGTGEIPTVSLKLDPAPPGGISTQTREADLGGFVLDLSNGGTGANLLEERILVKLVESGNLVTLDRNDSVSVSFGLTEIEPTYVEGYIGKERFVFKGSQAIDVFQNLDLETLRFAEPSAEIVFANSVGLDSRVEIHDLSALNSLEGTRSRLVGSAILAGPLILQGPTLPDTHQVILTRLPFDISNSNIDRFVNLKADQLQYDITLETNFNKTAQDLDNFASDRSEIAAFIEFRLPLEGVAGGLRLEETLEVDFSDVTVDLNGINGGELTLIIENQFPLQVLAQSVLLDENLLPIFTLTDQALIQAGQVDGQGRVTSPQRTEIKLSLDATEIQDLLAESRYLRLQYKLDTAPLGTEVGLYDDYRIKFHLVAGFSYELNN